MPRGGNQPLSNFAEAIGLPDGFCSRAANLDPPDAASAAAILWLQASRPARQRYWPALCLALVAQVEEALRLLQRDADDNILAEDQVVRETGGGQPLRQLVLRVGASSVPTRRFYNAVERVILVEMKRSHPSNPGHATGGWSAYRAFIRDVGRSSPAGRTAVAHWIWAHGVLPLPETLVAARRTRRPRPFFEVVRDLDTASGSTGGALYQAMVYAYFVADSPTLTVVSHPVNTGSSRARALGDVDGFLGEEIVLAAEAKDKDLTVEDEEDLAAFIEDVGGHPDVDAVVFARSFDEGVRASLDDAGIRTVSRAEMLTTVALWDVPKQENAIRAMRFFLARIQRSQTLLQRFIDFVDAIRSAEP